MSCARVKWPESHSNPELKAFLQVSVTFNQPTIILQSWPAEQQLAGAMKSEDGINETMQYLQAMPSLFSQVSCPSLTCSPPTANATASFQILSMGASVLNSRIQPLPCPWDTPCVARALTCSHCIQVHLNRTSIDLMRICVRSCSVICTYDIQSKGMPSVAFRKHVKAEHLLKRERGGTQGAV